MRNRSLVNGPLFLLGIAALGAFLVLALFARGSGPLPADLGVERFIQSVPWGFLTVVFGWITAFNGYTQFMAGFALLAFVILVNPRTIVFAALASLSGTLYTFSNSFVDRPRPAANLVQVTEHLGAQSFPSGHAVFALTYASLLVLCVAGKYLDRRGLAVAAVVGAGTVMLISVARLATGGHWPTDVYGGWLVAGGWILVLLALRPIGRPVLAWLGDPGGAWAARHPDLPNTIEGHRRLWGRALYTPIVQAFERLGFAVRGVLWALVGAMLIGSVLDLAERVDLYGSVRLILSTPFRSAIAIVTVLAIGGYAVWGYVRAFLDPLRRGRSVAGLVARMGFLSSAISYTLVVAFTVVIAFSSTATAGNGALDPFAAVGLLARYGAVYVLGAIVVAIGVSQAIDGWREPFTHDVLIEDAPHGVLFHAWTWFGRLGLWARAVLFGFLGVLIISETAGGMPWSTSFSHAFERMTALPGGSVAAAVLGVGLIALGLHSLGAARWMRLRPPVVGASD